MKRRHTVVLALMTVAGLHAAQAGVNSSIRVDAGEVLNKDVSTVNGQIRIGDGATVNGEVSTVNGSVSIGRDVKAESLSTVNGAIEVDDGSVIEGVVESVNGSISLTGSHAGEVATVNGSIELSGTDIEGDLSTYNGNITLSARSSVGGDIVIEAANRSSSKHRRRPLRIVIEDGSVVEGDVIVEDGDLEVEVFLRGGRVNGRVKGAKVIEE